MLVLNHQGTDFTSGLPNWDNDLSSDYKLKPRPFRRHNYKGAVT